MTLVEIMIALLIGAFLVGGIIQLFLNSKQSYRMTEGQSRLQENARFAIDLISQDIRMAGFRGCNSQSNLTSQLNTPTSFLYNFNIPLQGFESTSSTAWTPAIDASITTPDGGSDVITIRKAEGDGSIITAHANGAANLTLASTTNLSTDMTVIASDCTATDAFQITSISGNVVSHNTTASPAPGNATQPLSKSYIGGQVYPINTISYYVRANSLYRRIGSSASQELIEGVEQMQILYGEDTDATPDGTPNYYVSANSVVSMAKVVSIRISLLLRTIDVNLASTFQKYKYNGADITAGDRRIRQVFNTTIAVRNRLL
jgi:type IV pilus assembly protein PilW